MKKSVFVILLLLFAVSPLQAKKAEELLKMETEELFDLPLEELLDAQIASAGKMLEKVSEIPASVYIVTREDIETYGWRTLAEVIRHIPGFYTIYDYREDVIGVRGVMNDDNILFLINGVVQHTSEINEIMMPAEAIDRIEVVRGPMSVIYGSGALLGSVNIITNHIPYGEPLNMVSGSLGSLGVRKAYARASGEKGAFHCTMNASYYRTDGLDKDYRDMMDPGKYEALDPDISTRTEGFLERENFNVNLSAGYKGFYGDIQHNSTDSGVLEETLPYENGNEWENERTTVQFGYRRALSESIQIDGKIACHVENNFGKELIDRDDFPIRDEFQKISGEEERVDAELDLIWKPSDAFSMISGISYESVFNTSWDLSIPDWLAELNDPTIDGVSYFVSNQDKYAFFTQLNYKPMDRLKLTVGVRLEHHLQFDTKLELQGVGNATTVPVARYNEGGKSYVIPRVAGVYSLTEHQIVKLMYGEAIKPTSYLDMDLYDWETGIDGNLFRRNLEPERIKTIELNYLYSHYDFGLGLSLFQNDIDNLQSVSNKKGETKRDRTVPDYSGRMVTHGAELILSFRPVEPLDLEFGATWQKTRNKSDKDESVSFSPNLLLKARCGYRWREFTIAATGLFVDEMDPWVDKDDSPTSGKRDSRSEISSSDAFVIANLNLRYDHEKTGLFAALNVSNILDEEVRYPGSDADECLNGVIDEGRTFTAAVGWKF